MVSTTKTIIILAIAAPIVANLTKISRRNVFQSRRKRYLTFPMGSNFVMTISFTKPLLQVQPRGWGTLVECDVPFALPQDTRFFKRAKRRIVERKNFLEQLETALTEGGLVGKACVMQTICDILQYRKLKEKSLIKDLLYAVFAYPEDNSPQDKCDLSLTDCPFSLLEFLLRSLSNS